MLGQQVEARTLQLACLGIGRGDGVAERGDGTSCGRNAFFRTKLRTSHAGRASNKIGLVRLLEKRAMALCLWSRIGDPDMPPSIISFGSTAMPLL
jgi:hypothetical protein